MCLERPELMILLYILTLPSCLGLAQLQSYACLVESCNYADNKAGGYAKSWRDADLPYIIRQIHYIQRGDALRP